MTDVLKRSNLFLFLINVIASLYRWPDFLDNLSANFLKNILASLPIPPVVDRTIGVNVPCSTSTILNPFIV